MANLMGGDGDIFFERLASRVADLVVARLAPVKSSPTMLLTLKEVGTTIGRTPGAVAQMVHRGELRAIRGGRRLHIEKKEVDGWVERCRDTH